MSTYPSVDAVSITSEPVEPDWRWLLGSWQRLLAFGFGSGLAPKAPGTVGTLVAVPLFGLLQQMLPWIVIFALCLPLFALGVWICRQVGRELGVSDHGGLVWDEIVAFLLVLSLVFNRHYTVGEALVALVLAFALFRVFDIVKPYPIRAIEARFDGGFGVMVDDLFAAVYAVVAFKLIWWGAGAFM